MSYHIIKLSNGEDIVCKIIKDDLESLTISKPLKFYLVPRPFKNTLVESLTLTRWIQPYTTDTEMSLNKNSIITIVKAANDLSEFYELNIDKNLKPEPVEEEKEYENYLTNKKTIH